MRRGQIYIRRNGRRLPIYSEGGGIQEIINTIFELKSEPDKFYFFGIEEPEAHSHPDLQRKFFEELKSLSNRNQIFIATHSPVFIDRAKLESSWSVKILDGKTKIQRIGELADIIREIGARPSDIFFADRILFVEGKTEEIIIPAFFKKLKLDFQDLAIIPVEGKGKSRSNLKTWIKITRNILPIYIILDKDAKPDAVELREKGLIKSENLHVWQRGAIEAYYPLEIFQLAMKELNERYCLEIDVDNLIDKIKRGELNADKIDLGDKGRQLGKSWKVLLGETVANLLMERDVQVLDEVKMALENVLS